METVLERGIAEDSRNQKGRLWKLLKPFAQLEEHGETEVKS